MRTASAPSRTIPTASMMSSSVQLVSYSAMCISTCIGVSSTELRLPFLASSVFAGESGQARVGEGPRSRQGPSWATLPQTRLWQCLQEPQRPLRHVEVFLDQRPGVIDERHDGGALEGLAGQLQFSFQGFDEVGAGHGCMPPYWVTHSGRVDWIAWRRSYPEPTPYAVKVD
jgi:hypothetical protein